MKNKCRPKLLFMVHEFDFFLSHRKPLAQYAMKNGYEVCVASPGIPQKLSDDLKDFKFYPIGIVRKGKNPFFELWGLISILWLYFRLKPDLVHHFTIKPVVYGSFAALVCRIPVVVNTITGLGYVYFRDSLTTRFIRFFVGAMYKLCFHRPDLTVVFQNFDNRNLFVSKGYVDKSQTAVIFGTGVNIEQFQFSEQPINEVCRILFPGRLLWDKGVRELIEAGAILKEENLSFEIILCGKIDPQNLAGITRKQVQKWVDQYSWLQWPGPQKNMPITFASSDIVCLPSYGEGIPLALLEALSVGRPIVTTDTFGCREVVVNENGFLVPVKNSKVLARELSQLIKNVDLRKKMGARGRDLAEREFSQSVIFRQHMDLYQRLSEGAGVRCVV